MLTHISIDNLTPLFDALPDVVFFTKDVEGRYTHANLTLVRRLGLTRREDVIGRSADEVFPAFMGRTYADQDRQVLGGGVIRDQLEVHIFANRTPGWCITYKRPIRAGEDILGIIGISRDLGQPNGRHPTYDRLRKVLAHMQAHHDERIHITAMAELAGMSVAQLERHFRHVFQLTPQQVLTKFRIDSAMRLLQGDEAIASIGQACGYVDQSAFARQFKATVGMAPRDYRRLMGSGNGRPPVSGD